MSRKKRKVTRQATARISTARKSTARKSTNRKSTAAGTNSRAKSSLNPAPRLRPQPTRASAASSKAAARALVMRLMSIPGKSGEEAHVADFLLRQLRMAGAPADLITQDAAHKHTPIDGQVGNVILKLPGTYRAPRRLLMAHMDTVPICVGSQPVRRGRFVHSDDPTTGLGADDRAGVAVTLFTAMEILRNRMPHPPLTFLWTVQEEIGLQGARNVRLTALGNPKLAFNWDGGDPRKLTIGATGGYRLQIDIEGRASHAGNAPEQGVSAIAIASLAIADLHKKGWHGAVKKRGKSGTTNIGIIKGGAATNVVTDHCVVRAEARSHDPKFRREIVAQIRKSFQAAADQVCSAEGKKGSVKVDGTLDYESFQLDKSEPSVKVAAAAVRATGGRPLYRVTNGGVDANWMAARGIPTVTLGCGQKNQHMVSECLDLAQYATACEIAWKLAVPESP